jgi:hypothetical protein
MIEFTRYTRLKPLGFVNVVLDRLPSVSNAEPEPGLFVDFKRFDPETGKELADPERCWVTFAELEAKRRELESNLAVVKELLAFRS